MSTKHKVIGTLGALAIGTALLSACDSGSSYAYDYTGICVNKRTHVRVADWHCRSYSPVYGWLYIHSGDYYPGIGYPYRTYYRGHRIRYTFHPGRKVVVSRGGAPRTGGKISRSGYKGGYTGTTGKVRTGTGTGRSSGYRKSTGGGKSIFGGGSKSYKGTGGSRGIGGGSRGGRR